jgi:carbon monoxide dehydrogenase subunit G
MELTNDFRVSVPVEQAWAVLTDVERIAPCMPGAQLQEVEGDEFRGVVKVKVGPITASYKGKATFVERDDAAHRAVLRAEGRDSRGAGNANASITATLTPDGDGTSVSVVTDLTVTGKVAQFGRGVLADVSAKLLTQFVACLEETVLGNAPTAPVAAPAPQPADVPEPEPTPAHVHEPAEATYAGKPAEPAPVSGVRRIDSAQAKPIDLLDAAGGSAAKRAVPLLGVLVALWLLLRRRRRG